MAKNKANIMTMSWHMVMDFTPKIGYIIDSCNFRFSALCATKKCVIAVPAVDIANIVVDIGNCSGEDLDKFKFFELTALPAENINAPLIAECLTNIECRLVDDTNVGQYNQFILGGVKAWIDPDPRE